MKKNYLLGVVLFAFFVMRLVFAGALESITPEEAFKLQSDAKAIIIDVREPNELSVGKIKGAMTIPLSEMKKDRNNWDKKIAELKKDQTVIVYCHSGKRAEVVGSELAKIGFKVFNLGTFDAWKSKGLPTDK